MRHHLLAAAALSGLALSACSVGRAENAGPSVSRNYQVGGFTGLEVAGPFDVKVITGKAVSVSARGPEKLLDATAVEVKDGRLVIRPQRKGWFGGMSWGSHEPAVFTVTVPALDSAEVAGSGDIDIDRVSGERFRGGIAGSGNLRLPQVAVQDFAVEIAGSGGVEARGQTRTAKYEIAGSGDVDASGLTAVEAAAEIAGSGNIKARVTGTARASIMGSGDIEISGGAKCTSSKQGSGSINCS